MGLADGFGHIRECDFQLSRLIPYQPSHFIQSCPQRPVTSVHPPPTNNIGCLCWNDRCRNGPLNSSQRGSMCLAIERSTGIATQM